MVQVYGNKRGACYWFCNNAVAAPPIHIHLLLYFSPKSPELMKVIGNGKRFLAYEIVKRLETNDDYKILDLMQKVVTLSDRKNK